MAADQRRRNAAVGGAAGGAVGRARLDAGACSAPGPAEGHNKPWAIAGDATRCCGTVLKSCYKSAMTTALEGLPDDLPDDPGGLRAAVLAMRAELAAERAERQRLEDQNE